jgi:hypothetical protein
VHTADFLPEQEGSTANIYVSTGMLDNYRRFAQRRDTVLSAYFALECPIVEPAMFRGLIDAQRYFKRIFCYSDSDSLARFVGRPMQFLPCRYPAAFEDVHEPIWKGSERKFLVMINTNRLPRIAFRELYSERLRAIEFFARYGEIELYGNGWNRPPYRVGKTWVPYTFRRIHSDCVQMYWKFVRPNPEIEAARKVYRGSTSNKANTLGQYTFCLCFENMILRGWITEKIFDCFYTGTVPIYWGAPDIEDYIPPACFIDMRQFADYNQLRSYLKSLTTKDIRAYKQNARDYLNSPVFQPFSKQTFVNHFRTILKEDARLVV